jgi:signal transduction histidine kinase
MKSASRLFRMRVSTISSIWQKSADSTDFIWLARFRLLIIYTILKSILILAAGLIGMRVSASFFSPSLLNLTLLLWIEIILGMSISTLLLILGVVLASKSRPRSIGLTMLGASDICVLLAVLYSSILNNLFMLLIVLVFISFTTPLFIERISRYAQGFLQSKHELASLKDERDFLLLRFYQELAKAIESERLSLKREIHDGLMQELSALSLQVSMTIMRNSADGILQMNASEVARLEATLRRAVAEARKMMYNLRENETLLVLEK